MAPPPAPPLPLLVLLLVCEVAGGATSHPEQLGLFLAPCNASDPLMQWRGAALSTPGAVSAIESQGAVGQCLSTLSKDPISLGPCGPAAALWLYNSSNLTLAVQRPTKGGSPGLVGACLDVHGGSGPELDLWACHTLPAPSCHAAGLCSSDWRHQQLQYDVSTGLLAAAHPTGPNTAACNAQCVTLGEPNALRPVDGREECSSSAPLQLLPQDRGDESPACLDGSPYGFYHVKSRSASTRWTVYLEGGGWWCAHQRCFAPPTLLLADLHLIPGLVRWLRSYDEQLCWERAQSDLGSSKHFPATHTCSCMNVLPLSGQIDPDCNCLFLKYADGGSFAGYRPEPVRVPGQNASARLYFRGIVNLDATIEYALVHLGLASATEVVIAGGSAGGLSTYLHADRIAAAVRKGATGLQRVRAASDVGFFIDHDNYGHFRGGVPNTPSWGSQNFT